MSKALLLPLFLSLIPMFSWGLTSILAAKLSRLVGGFNSGFLIQLFGFIVTLMLWPLFFLIPQKINWLGLIIQGILGAGTYILYCKALKSGKVPIIVPVVSSWALITVALSIIFFQEAVNVVKIISISFTIIGIIILTINWKSLKSSKLSIFSPGVILAILVALGWGFAFFYLGSLSRQMGWFFTTAGSRLFIVASFFLALITHSNRTKIFQKVPWKILLPVAVLDVVAFTTYNLAVSHYDVSYVSVITSASPLVAVILGQFFLKEKTSLLQKIGIALIISGIIGLQL